MIQQILIVIIFLGAVGYLGNIGYRAFFSSRKDCATGCGKCGTGDLDKIVASTTDTTGVGQTP